MVWLKKNLVFTIVMAVLAGLLAVEVFMILGQRAEAQSVEADFRAKVEEFRRLANQDVLPHQRNVDLTAEQIERRREELQLYYQSMQGREGLAEELAAHPASRADAFFDIASFVDEYRERAREVLLDPRGIDDTHFGFEAYATVGPAEGNIATVYKQRLIVAHILDRLFEAQPEALIEIRRPGEGRTDGEGQQQGGGGFRLNPQLSAAISGVADTSAYRVVFTGRASTLRAFLNELTSFDMPLIVRNVEAVPASEAADGARRETAGGRRPARRAAPAPTNGGEEAEAPATAEGDRERIPLVADNLSRFTVSMEFVEVRGGQNERR